MHVKIRENFYMNMNTTALPVSNKLFYSCFIKAQELKKIENKFVFQEIFLEEVEWWNFNKFSVTILILVEITLTIAH